MGYSMAIFEDDADLEIVDRSRKAREFIEDLGAEALHLGCHAVWHTGRFSSYLQVGSDLRLSLRTFEAGGTLRMEETKLVIINACHSGFTRPDQIVGFVNLFWEGGVRTIVATECPIPSSMGSIFARALWQRVADGESVSDALNRLGDADNLMELRIAVLCYSLYGSAETRLGLSSIGGWGEE
jgi:CHAT domain-containing protein